MLHRGMERLAKQPATEQCPTIGGRARERTDVSSGTTAEGGRGLRTTMSDDYCDDYLAFE